MCLYTVRLSTGHVVVTLRRRLSFFFFFDAYIMIRAGFRIVVVRKEGRRNLCVCLKPQKGGAFARPRCERTVKERETSVSAKTL